jgi:polysaccharide biosynthesis transport protein
MSRLELNPASEQAALSRNVRRVLRQWPLVAICAVLASVAAYTVSSSEAKQYKATATIEVDAPDVLAQLNGESNVTTSDAAALDAATISALITEPTILERASTALRGRLSPAALSSALQVAVGTDDNLVTVSATTTSAALSATVANTTATTFVNARRGRTIADDSQAETDLKLQLRSLGVGGASSPLGQLIGQRLRAVEAISAGGGGSDVSIVQTAQAPSAAVSPRPKRLAIVGLVLGLLLGLAFVSVRARFDDRIREPQEFEDLWPLPLVGTIPSAGKLRDAGRTVPPAGILEAFGSARATLRYLHVGGDIKTLVVTSAGTGEGKTTSSWQLAVAAAVAESRVLVIEADLRKPNMANMLGVHPTAGLTEMLAGLKGLDETTIGAVKFGDAARGISGSVDVIFAGTVPPSPVALLERGRLQELLEVVRDLYDVIIIDTPPTVVGDALVLAGQADGVLVVARCREPTRRSFARLKEQLEGTGTPIVGMLINGSSGGVVYGYPSVRSSA